MEESENISNNEIDLSDSWTVVNSDDSDVNLNAEVGEPSDSESLEVLEVEQGEPNQRCQDLEIEGEENDEDGECSKDCGDSFLNEDPLIHLATIQKGKKYVHHPSVYVNMWLSVAMVIAIAVTLGLGMGHYLGSVRFARAKDMIHHLKYENQMLEQELADVNMKNKRCESDLHSRDNIYANSINGHDEEVCYVEENPFFTNFRRQIFVNNTLPSFMHWLSYINNGERTLDIPFEGEFTINRYDVTAKNSDHDHTSSDVALLPKLEKWNEFRGNLKLPASDSKMGLAGLPNAEHLSEVAHKVIPLVSENPYKVPSQTVKSRLASSSIGFCRSKINQCVLREEKWQKNGKKCYVLSKAQLLCSLLQRSKRKQGNNFLFRKQKAYEKKDKKSDITQFSFEKKRHTKIEKTRLSHDKKKGKGENGKHSRKMNNNSKPDSQRTKNKDNVKNSSMNIGSSKNNKFKYAKKNENGIKQENKHQSKKPTYNNSQHQKKQLPKAVPKYHKHFKYNDSKDKIKKNKKKIITNTNERKYSEKFLYTEKMNRKNAEKLNMCSNDKRRCKHHKNYKKITENKKYFPHSRFASPNSHHNPEKFSRIENSDRNNMNDIKECSSNKGHCRFHSNGKKMSNDRKHYTHYKLASTGESCKFRTQSNEKNGSENASCKYSFVTHQKDKKFPKYWKERNKIYDFHMQGMKVFNT